MTNTGLISGIVELADDERYGPMGGYEGDLYDAGVYDRTVFSKSKLLLGEDRA